MEGMDEREGGCGSGISQPQQMIKKAEEMCDSAVTEISSTSDQNDGDLSIHREVRSNTKFERKEDEFRQTCQSGRKQ